MGFHITDGWLTQPGTFDISDYTGEAEVGFIPSTDYIDVRGRWADDDYIIRCSIDHKDGRWVPNFDDIEDNDSDCPEGTMPDRVLVFCSAVVQLTDELNFTDTWKSATAG